MFRKLNSVVAAFAVTASLSTVAAQEIGPGGRPVGEAWSRSPVIAENGMAAIRVGKESEELFLARDIDLADELVACFRPNVEFVEPPRVAHGEVASLPRGFDSGIQQCLHRLSLLSGGPGTNMADMGGGSAR